MKSTDADLDMDFVINEADAALRQALQAQGLVVGGADTQDRLTEFVTDSLRTTQYVVLRVLLLQAFLPRHTP